MEIAAIYSVRDLPRPSLPQEVLDVIANLKISATPVFRRPNNRRREPNDNWRDAALIDAVRKVRERDDPDYDEINAFLNKLTRQTYTKLILEIIARIEKRDALFRLRVTTLLFDRGIRQNFFAPLMADAYKDIIDKFSDASQDLLTQVSKFDELYDTEKLIVVPSSSDPGFDEAVIAWTKLKEMKRGFAVYVSELFARGLIPQEIIAARLTQVLADLRESIAGPKTDMREEHVDALVRFLFAMVPKMPELKPTIREILAIPRTETPSLKMMSRFKLEDSLK
jgi:hypothetical protein